MIELPPIPQLIQRIKALAAFDLIFSPEWDYRYYSFNAHWAPDEQMASMRNGSGDEWWIVFYKDGRGALKGLGHESAAWSKGREKLSKALNSALPPELADFAKEPAFRWEATSFVSYILPGSTIWKRAADQTAFAQETDTGEADLLQHLIGSPSDYVSFVEDYFEKSVPAATVASIFALQPITASTVSALNPDVTLEEISSELFEEIGYPIST